MLEIIIVIVIFSIIAWFFGADGGKIIAFYLTTATIIGLIALFAAFTAYFIKIFS